MPKIQCNKIGCRVIVDKEYGNYCPDHKKSSNVTFRRKLEHQHDAKGRMIYSTKRWKILSKKKLAVDPFCECCLNDKIERLADVVDHIIEIKDDQSKAYTWTNLMSLCHEHHNRKTADVERMRKNREYSEKKRLFSI